MRIFVRAIAVIILGIGVGLYIYGNSLLPVELFSSTVNLKPEAVAVRPISTRISIDDHDLKHAAAMRGVGAGFITVGIVGLVLTFSWKWSGTSLGNATDKSSTEPKP